jgi:hypothetical protein
MGTVDRSVDSDVIGERSLGSEKPFGCEAREGAELMCEVCLIAKTTRNGELGPVDTPAGFNLTRDVLKSEKAAVLLGDHPDGFGE